ncbi:RTT106 (YNL206C) [Zygosaccharomyces parabailii]|nr:RTT106 (YNL206C) [Zygosaccharomyces parabailii]CDH08266.1 related to Histone chaperone RTT106 [Zygosaccharomyces bailii ISA1307]
MGSFLDQLAPQLREEVLAITKSVPGSFSVFQGVYDSASDKSLNNARKSRKLGPSEEGVDKANIIFALEDVSVLSPLRKKLNLALHLSSGDLKPTLSLLREGRQEFSLKNLGQSITMATFLPVAEKQGNVYLFINYTQSTDERYRDPLLITLNKDAVMQQFKQNGIIDKEIVDFTKCIEYMRKQAILAGFRIADPFFTNSGQQPSSFHVECHRGTKEGTLYFLPEHLLFGFKKPILVFESSDIESITYTSITRLTFNVNIVTKSGEKYEFSMIDQSEYAKIDEYVKRKQVTDKSMSEELKAKSNYKTQQAGQGDPNAPSALKEATQLMEGGSGLNGVDLPSDDDDEGDENFEAESGSSDSSDRDSEQEEEDRVAERETMRDEQHEEQHEMEDAEAEEAEDEEDEQELDGDGEDVSIEMDDDDDGSGVEYD